MLIKEYIYSLDTLENLAAAIIKNATSKTLLFEGDMGVGKTTLIKAISQELGCTDQINSPTFSIVNEYEIENGLIYHFDLYRIKDEDEALNFGIEDYLFSKHWIFMEWPNKIENLLLEHSNRIEIKVNENGLRTLSMSEKNNFNQDIVKLQ